VYICIYFIFIFLYALHPHIDIWIRHDT